MYPVHRISIDLNTTKQIASRLSDNSTRVLVLLRCPAAEMPDNCPFLPQEFVDFGFIGKSAGTVDGPKHWETIVTRLRNVKAALVKIAESDLTDEAKKILFQALKDLNPIRHDFRHGDFLLRQLDAKPESGTPLTKLSSELDSISEMLTKMRRSPA